jgi:hypothetical protein
MCMDRPLVLVSPRRFDFAGQLCFRIARTPELLLSYLSPFKTEQYACEVFQLYCVLIGRVRPDMTLPNFFFKCRCILPI